MRIGVNTTVNVSVAECVSVPSVPVIVIAYVPAGAVSAAVNVTVLVPPADTDAGLKLAVTPLGKPEADKSTVSENPLSADTVAVAETFCPSVTEAVAGTEIVKSLTDVDADPVIPVSTVSVPVIVWAPGVFRVAVKFPVPFVSELAVGSEAELSELVMCTVPP